MTMKRLGALCLVLWLVACGSEAVEEPGHTMGGAAGASGGASGASVGGGAGVSGSAGQGASGGSAGQGATAGSAGQAGVGGGDPDGGGAAGADAGPTHVPDAFPTMPYTGVYAGLDSLSGATLVNELCQLVKLNHQSMSYTAARQVVFQKSDNHGGKVLGVYDGFWHDTTHADLNIEHTWPQSKGADTLPAKSDLHHLFPVQASFNSARGNITFGEVVQRTWPATLTGDASCTDAMPGNDDGCYSIKGKDASGVTVFEPRDGHKGDAARAVFFFSIRYGTNCQPKPLGIFDLEHPVVTEAVLKKWNLHDPPSDHERQRNDVIQVEQGARNPFIDHPELVDSISFQ